MRSPSLALLALAIGLGSLVIWFYSSRCEMKEGLLSENINSVEDVKALFPQTPDEIRQQLADYLQEAKKEIQAIIAIPDEQRTFANTAQALDRLSVLSNLSVKTNLFYITEMVSMDQAMRSAAHEAVKQVQEFWVDNIGSNKEFFKAFKAYVEGNARSEQLNEEQRYYLKEAMDDFMRAGLDLPDDQLQKVKELKKELSKLTLEFDRNIAADKSTITVSKDGLKGIGDDFINTLKKTDDGNYIIGLDYPTYFRIMDYCAVEDTRKRLYETFSNRAYPINEQLLQDIISKRDALANLLGFSSYAALDLDDQMVKKPERAEQFIQDLIARSKKKVEQEFTQWTADLPESVTLTADGKVKPWDLKYLETNYKKKHLAVDELKIAEYFPMKKTIDGLLDVYRQFFGIDFEEVPATGFWHEEVKLVKVYTLDKKQLLGYLMLDLFPRPDKYSHACQIDIIPTINNPDGSRMPAVAVVLANFPKATKEKPSLLMRSDVKTFFHEFGHALHSILGATQMASFSGTKVKRDFVELPSQMLEEWLWDKDILQKVSSHYQTGDSLPDELINKIITLKRFDSGNFVQTQSLYSMMALDYFKKGEKKDPYKLLQALTAQIRPGVVFAPENHMYAAFGHLTGYGAKYYGYLWSKVFALDLFAEIKKHGLLNAAIGKKYIQEVIGKGGSKDPNELLKNFLGREPRMDAFLQDLGL